MKKLLLASAMAFALIGFVPMAAKANPPIPAVNVAVNLQGAFDVGQSASANAVTSSKDATADAVNVVNMASDSISSQCGCDSSNIAGAAQAAAHVAQDAVASAGTTAGNASATAANIANSATTSVSVSVTP